MSQQELGQNQQIAILFPDKVYEFELGIPVVFLGANGSGKTRLCTEIEKRNDTRFSSTFSGRRSYPDRSLLVHRLSAQKSLSIPDIITIHGIESSEKDLFIGAQHESASKYQSKYNSNPSTALVNDYDKALSLFFSRNNIILETQHDIFRTSDKIGLPRPPLVTTPIEQVIEIWNYLLPNRKLDLSGGAVHVGGNVRYHGKEMSDGERVILYMIIQVLSLKPKSILIIDEPELHIHKAILNKLWDKLEEIRKNCVFIYVTHDLDFAASRNTNKVLWVRGFDGNKWDYNFINTDDYSELPEALLYEIIGTRKKIVFVEGERGSFDYQLYKELYADKNYHVIPCGSCKQVINYVKAKRGYNALGSIGVVGIIDRDFRTDDEINSLAKDGIYTLNVAEVENLFVVPELIDFVCRQMGSESEKNEEAKRFVIDQYNRLFNSQIKEATIKTINSQIKCMNIKNYELEPQEIVDSIINEFTADYIQRIMDDKKIIYDKTTDMTEILRIFNHKGLVTGVGEKLGIKSNDYPRRVINLLKYDTGGSKQQIINALSKYIPDLP
ncbi:hypothetical protein MsAg5_16730 [Methanosarcinaceae archaeon Ag5]|uniref:DUF4435 domain-containing protein n=1 Tax=Methanolapillus africanus TaxID=3028297 RepID=A0AAE4SEG6_9EURY|nr:hypothetical protein [Methanosarcinaceae archaeon Ag5]